MSLKRGEEAGVGVRRRSWFTLKTCPEFSGVGGRGARGQGGCNIIFWFFSDFCFDIFLKISYPKHMNSGSVLSVNQDRRRTPTPASTPRFKSL